MILTPSVSVIGCGWFGLPLAKALVAAGYRVKGSKRTHDGVELLARLGVEAFRLDLEDDAPLPASLLDAQVLVINIPPGLKRGNDSYLTHLERLKLAMPIQPERIIFVSSTGVYPESDKQMFEADACPHSPQAEILLSAEALFASANTCVLRFAGLVGPGRHPGRFFAGRTGISGGQLGVNLVHLDDCVAATRLLIDAPRVASVYNLCAPTHPSRAQFYTEASRVAGLALPEFIDAEARGKIIDASLICQQLGFSYQYPDPMMMLTAAGAF